MTLVAIRFYLCTTQSYYTLLRRPVVTMAGVTTSDLLGPLTTLWTPPSACLSTVTATPPAMYSGSGSIGVDEATSALYLGATGNAVDPVCYPPRFTTDHVYSPGICPSGTSEAKLCLNEFYAGCADSAIVRLGWTSACAPSSNNQFYFQAPTTGVQCCPSGMTCDDYFVCSSAPAASSRVAWVLSQNGFGLNGMLVTSTFPGTSVLAKPILVAYQATDAKVLAAASQSTSTQGSPSGATPTATSGSLHSNGDGRLSGGAVAGIAIGAVCVGVLLAAAFTFLILRLCLGYRKVPKNDRAFAHTSGDGVGQMEQRGPPPSELPSLGQTMSERAELGSPEGSK